MVSMLADSAKHALAALPHLPSSPSDLANFLLVRHDELPSGLQSLPSMFRIIAACFFAPVLALTVVDVLGWAVFKLILRPLGYTHTVRFKDPDPPSTLVPVSGAVDATKSSPIVHGALIPSSTSSSSASEAGSSAPSSPASSERLALHDEPSASSTSTESAVVHHHHHPHHRSISSSSSSSRSSTSSGETVIRKMSRDRAQSVGLEGPLFEEGESTTPGTLSESEGEARDYMAAALRMRERRGDGVPRGGFKLGLTEVKARDYAARPDGED
ncbi:hypothetical protein JCM10213_004651 [Rhodosporidiobolus nylandii]